MACDGVYGQNFERSYCNTSVRRGLWWLPKEIVRIFSLQEVLEGMETVKKGLEADGEETDEAVHSESAGALAMSSDCLQGILCKLFTKGQSLNYGDVSKH